MKIYLFNLVTQIIFWSTLSLIVSSYFIYPIFILIWSKFLPIKIRYNEYFPKVTIIISAYNEEKSIAQKIKNTSELLYPEDKLEIIVGSDGSTDKTVEIAKKYQSEIVKVIDFNTNKGKTAVQNECVKISNGDILVFTDAASFVGKDSLKKIVRHFTDERVGCVAGRLRFIDTDTNMTTESQGIYWKYESKIREIESSIGQLIGVDGPLYAIRRSNYVMLKHNIISDLISPLLVLAAGSKAILEKEAIVDEYPTIEYKQEFSTRRRITLRGLVGLFEHPSLLNLFKHTGLSLQIFFHKLIRWFVGPLIAINFIAALFLINQLFFKYVVIIYLIFIFTIVIGFILNSFQLKIKLFTIPYYFFLVNFAATSGIIDFILNKQSISWKPVR